MFTWIGVDDLDRLAIFMGVRAYLVSTTDVIDVD